MKTREQITEEAAIACLGECWRQTSDPDAAARQAVDLARALAVELVPDTEMDDPLDQKQKKAKTDGK